MTLTIIQGLGPSDWWLCVRINRLAMDVLDHSDPSEQGITPILSSR
jgi:hypothetical protein